MNNDIKSRQTERSKMRDEMKEMLETISYLTNLTKHLSEAIVDLNTRVSNLEKEEPKVIVP